MSRTTTPSPRTVGTLIALTLGLGVSLVLLAGGARPARAASPSQLRQRISAGQGQVSALSGAVSSASKRVGKLNAAVAALESQVMRLQADVNAKRAQLLKLRSELAAAKTRLAQLEAAQAHAEQVLAQQLVGSYEADRPDLVSVVLEAPLSVGTGISAAEMTSTCVEELDTFKVAFVVKLKSMERPCNAARSLA